MKYQNYLNNVLKLLQDYRDSVNGVKAIYDSDKAKHDRELKDMQGKYTDEYYKKPCSFLLWGALGVYMKSEKMPHLAPQISTKIKKAVCII